MTYSVHPGMRYSGMYWSFKISKQQGIFFMASRSASLKTHNKSTLSPFPVLARIDWNLNCISTVTYHMQLESGIRVNIRHWAMLKNGSWCPCCYTPSLPSSLQNLSDPPIHPHRLSQWRQTLRSRTKMWNWNWWLQGTELPGGNTSCPLAHLHLPASHLSLHTSTSSLELFKGNTVNTSAVSDGAAQKRVGC